MPYILDVRLQARETRKWTLNWFNANISCIFIPLSGGSCLGVFEHAISTSPNWLRWGQPWVRRKPWSRVCKTHNGPGYGPSKRTSPKLVQDVIKTNRSSVRSMWLAVNNAIVPLFWVMHFRSIIIIIIAIVVVVVDRERSLCHCLQY